MEIIHTQYNVKENNLIRRFTEVLTIGENGGDSK